MKYLAVFTLILSCFACQIQTTTLKPIPFSDQQFAVREFKSLMDSSFKDNSNLSNYFTYKSIEKTGRTNLISEKKAIQMLRAMRLKNTIDSLPLFEVKNSNNVIITVNGKGLWGPIWALILIDKTSREVQKIQFNHKAETPGLGAKITEEKFCKQYLNQIIEFSHQQTSILQKDGSASKIDAIAGATITSKGVFMMMNTNLNIYSKYFQE